MENVVYLFGGALGAVCINWVLNSIKEFKAKKKDEELNIKLLFSEILSISLHYKFAWKKFKEPHQTILTLRKAKYRHVLVIDDLTNYSFLNPVAISMLLQLSLRVRNDILTLDSLIES